MSFSRCSVPLLAVLCVLACGEGAAGVKQAPKLKTYNVNASETSVSGLSSGGFMAVQFHVAFSGTIVGAGITAGGPYYCAEDSLTKALLACETQPILINVQTLVTFTLDSAKDGSIDPPDDMKGDKVFLISGTKDTIVVQGVMEKLAEYYSNFGTVTHKEFSIPAVHSQITNDYGNACGSFATSPYIINCNYPSGEDMLLFMYSGLKPATGSQAIPANLLEFDQTEFIPSGTSMDDTGYVYVPTACQNMSACRLHIAFHGCQQGKQSIGDVFALHAGFNAMAEVNNFIVLYPQVKSTVLSNPNGCWDWWGYTGKDYAFKTGKQMAGVKLMMNRLAGL